MLGVTEGQEQPCSHLLQQTGGRVLISAHLLPPVAPPPPPFTSLIGREGQRGRGIVEEGRGG